MRTRRVAVGRAVAIRMERGEEVISSLEKACADNGVKVGLIFGIGALGRCTVYSSKSAERLEPLPKELEGPIEIASATGNATRKDGKPYIHLHAVLGLGDHTSVAGHLKSGTISLTGEFFIIELSGEIERKEDSALKMNLMDL